MNYTLTTDEQLIILIKQEEDELAFREVYRRYWREVFMVAYRKIKSREVAEELTQNLFLNLWEKRKESAILNLQPWLFGAIKYSIINYYKSQIVHEKYIKHLHVTAQVSVSSTEQMTMQADLSDAIDKGVSLLPQKTQQVFKLSRFENRSVKEISRDLNISERLPDHNDPHYAVSFPIGTSLNSVHTFYSGTFLPLVKKMLIFLIASLGVDVRFFTYRVHQLKPLHE
jgi:RNA polymerase sigma-70 factor (ECF subfamily)